MLFRSRRGHTIQAAQDLSTNIDSLITAYGAAMVGLMVYAIVVPTVAKITSHAAEYEKNKIQKQQNKMLETWGPDVLPDDNTGPKNN